MLSGMVTCIIVLLFSSPVHEEPHSVQFPFGYEAISAGVSTTLLQLTQ